MKFKVVGKSLILTDYSHKITEGENSFDTVEITVPRYHDDCDLSTLSFRFSEISDDGETSAIQILHHTKCNERYIYLKGTITSDFSTATGNVVFMLTGVNSENIVAKFQSTPYTISDDISLTSLPNETTAEQLFNLVQIEAEKAIAAAERAEIASQTPAPAEIYPASSARVGGVLSGNDISVSEKGNVTVNSVNGKTLGKSVPPDAVFTDTVYNDTDINNKFSEIISYLGYTDDIIGLHADFESGVFTRLGAAAGLNGGTDFDKFPMYAGRKRCNVLDDGTITAYFGDKNFCEDGSNGQVMVYQPNFYYKVVPLKLDRISGGIGYHLRKANYYISAVPKNGFKLHPAFYNEDGKPVDYILFSAYEGSIFDTSANTYLQNDEQVADFSTDKLCSISCVKPCSGKMQQLTRANAEQLAKNRGTKWHIETIKTISVNQLLMVIEFGTFNIQNKIGYGVINNANISNENNAAYTGTTSLLGNATGMSDGENGTASVTYRGMENPWGNIWKYINGINEYVDANSNVYGYVCNDFNFSENKGTENYKQIEFCLSNNHGYISSFGYSQEYDWIFMPTENTGDSSLPIGDAYYCNPDVKNQWRTLRYGGEWFRGFNSGIFLFHMAGIDTSFAYSMGCRMIYIPQSNHI